MRVYYCAVCQHEMMFGGPIRQPCLRKARHWVEPNLRNTRYLPVCAVHAAVWIQARMGDLWPILSDDPEADYEAALQALDAAQGATPPDVVVSVEAVRPSEAPGPS